MIRIATLADKSAVEAEMPVGERWSARSLYEQLQETAAKFPDQPAVSFQLRAGPTEKAVTETWRTFLEEVTRAANLFRRLGISQTDCVAYVLPNCLEAPVVLLAGATAGIVIPINPLLTAEQIGMILHENDVKAVVTLAPFPKTDVPQKVADAVALAPTVGTVVQVDLRRYLAPPLAWIIPFVRPKITVRHKAKVVDFRQETRRVPGDRLEFAETLDDRFCARFHTGGTTGLPKFAQHRASGIVYNGWCGSYCMFTEQDVLICPLPMFHVFAAYAVFMSCLVSGAQMVMVTPQGYRGEGVYPNFWKLVARWKVSFLITVPTAAARLMQVPVDADISTLRLAVSGSAAMPLELFQRFEAATGVQILEGYGMTETTCLISLNPPYGERRVGSVGIPFPYTDVRILTCDAHGAVVRECGTDEQGEICVRAPGVAPGQTYTDPDRNRGLFAEEDWLRTGDLGRIDADGYIWITGRAKDLIIRGGHNIDPVTIEEAMLTHPKVAFAGAIGQPDPTAGEVVAVYVELLHGAEAGHEELMAHARATIGEHAAVPKHLEILHELPKTAVGKIFKPDLRRRAIRRVYDHALEKAGMDVTVAEVVEDPKRGLVAVLRPGPGPWDDGAVNAVLGNYTVPWRWGP
jgi:fatty-acyl-CoA synthase